MNVMPPVHCMPPTSVSVTPAIRDQSHEHSASFLYRHVPDRFDLVRGARHGLFHEQGQPYEMIAEAVGRPVGTVKTWLHRARLEILDRLRNRGLVPDEAQPKTPRVQGE